MAANLADDTIERITADRGPHSEADRRHPRPGPAARRTADRGPRCEPYGWPHWPEHPWFAYQFRRGLGETQEGGGTVSEVFQAAGRTIPGPHARWQPEG